MQKQPNKEVKLRPFASPLDMKKFLDHSLGDYAQAMFDAGEYPTLERASQASYEEVFSFYNTPRPEKVHYPCYIDVVTATETVEVGVTEMVSLLRSGQLVAFVNQIWIYPPYRSLGYAAQAMLRLEELARAQKLFTLELNVLIHRVNAQRLYQKLGYTVTRRWKGGYATHMTRIDMRKTLTK